MQVTVGQDKTIYHQGGMTCDLTLKRNKEPVRFTPETAQKIIDEISSGKSLVSICAEEGMPDSVTVLRWRNANPEFDDLYKQAIVIRARIRHEEAEQEVYDLKHCEDKTKAYVADVRNRNRFRLMEIGSPHDYSPKMQMMHQHSGSVVSISLDLSAPQTVAGKETEIIEHNQSPLQFEPNQLQTKTDISEAISPPLEDKSKA